MLFVRQILSLDFKQDCEHCILSLKKQEMTCVTEVHYIVVGRGANNLEAYLLLYLSWCGVKKWTGLFHGSLDFGATKGQIKLKADWRAVDSPKKRTNGIVLFAVKSAKKQTRKICSFVFYGESTTRQSAFSFIWPLSDSSKELVTFK